MYRDLYVMMFTMLATWEGLSQGKKTCTSLVNDSRMNAFSASSRTCLSVASGAWPEFCAGALFGMGESVTHRIELAATLRKLNVDSIPINILNPIKGTPLDHLHPLPPMEILMTIAVFRFMLPDKDIKLCGGKEKNLRQLLPLGIIAGANSLMTGNYLTTTVRDSKLDHEMIADLGLIPTRDIDICKCGTEGENACMAGGIARRKPARK